MLHSHVVYTVNMSCSEEESTAASVLSQMSQIQQSPSDNVETQGMSVKQQLQQILVKV